MDERSRLNQEGNDGDENESNNKKNGSLSTQEDGQSVDGFTPSGEPSEAAPEREQWSSKLDFILSCVGFAVGLGNVWRFPYLCYKNGGGAFLVPYFICLVCGGVPVFFLEIALGQFMSKGGIGCWGICPLMKGIGVATTVIVFLLNIYYIVILAWDIYYMVMSFDSVLPWSHCNNDFNTEKCTVSFAANNCTDELAQNGSVITTCVQTLKNASEHVDPVVEFWEKKILKISDGIDQPDGIVWELALSLLFCWLLCYFCIWKGVKWTGKVVYFTATFPYVVLTILLIRGLTLEGASDGIIFYVKPDFSRLGDSQVWLDAGTQIFFSYAIALGAMTALGSYNKFTNNCYRDCVIIAGVNSFTSLYAGFAIFSVLGFMAHQQGVSVQDVAESGPGLAFIAYPKAVSLMPIAPFWAVLFFFMILMLGLDSQFVGVEAFSTVVVDFFPVLRKNWNREIFLALYCGLSYLIGLSMVTRGGMYVFQLFDYYSASGMALLWVCFFECVTIAWIYGGGRFYDNIEVMIGYRINLWLRFCWTVLAPFITLVILVFMYVKFEPLKYNRTYVYPGWAQGMGMSLAFSSMICIPVYTIIKLLVTSGSLRQRWKVLTTPQLDAYQIPDHWDPALKERILAASAKQRGGLLMKPKTIDFPPAYEDIYKTGDGVA